MVVVGRQHSQGQVVRDEIEGEESKVVERVAGVCGERLSKLAHFC
jgi:hypothetical protein